MATSVFLAKLIGPVMFVAALGLFINTAGYRAMAQEFLRSPALLYLAGVLTMTTGLAIVLNHNVWVANWPVLITILGWLGVIGGAVRMALPDITRKVGDSMLRNDMALRIGGAGWLALGALLCFFGYFRGFVR
jgi:Co/Zn/Cd efflux system component